MDRENLGRNREKMRDNQIEIERNRLRICRKKKKNSQREQRGRILRERQKISYIHCLISSYNASPIYRLPLTCNTHHSHTHTILTHTPHHSLSSHTHSHSSHMVTYSSIISRILSQHHPDRTRSPCSNLFSRRCVHLPN